MASFTIGIDYGTNSVRAIVADCGDGAVIGTSVFEYPSGEQGVLLHPKDPHLARQNPADYIQGLRASVIGALAEAQRTAGFSAADVIGIGVDTTGSTPLPIDAQARPLAMDPAWSANLAAHAWLWKDHTAADEAARITAIAREHAPEYLAPIGGTYSSEWWWSKIWHCLNAAPDVFDAAASWVELADLIPAVLAGVDDPKRIVRCVCAAGHKAMYSEAWGGLPSEAFLARLDPKLADLRDRLYDRAYPPGRPAGSLSAEWAAALGLPPGISIAMGGFDAHYGAVGAGIRAGTLVKIIGTSTCDCAIAPRGVCAIKPSGVPYERLTPGEMVVVSLKTGVVIDGALRPSSDTPTHLELYRAFECGAIVHTHSEFATMFAQARLPIRCMGTTHADYFHGDIPVTRPMRREEVEQEYERNTGMVIAETFRTGRLSPAEVPAVLVASHGPFAWGLDAAAAIETAQVLEYLARLEWRVRTMAPEAEPPDDFLIDTHYHRKHGPTAYYGQE